MALQDCFSQIFSYTGYVLKSDPAELMSDDRLEQNYIKLIDDARSAAGVSEDLFTAALFPVCAWVDEQILTSGGELSRFWIRYQLQRRFFHTTNAGEEFFVRMAALAEDDTALRGVYAYCLSLGFCGRYFREEDAIRINEIKQDNLKKLVDGDAIDYPDQLFPNAYATAKVHRKWNNRPGIFTMLMMVLFPVIFFILYFSYDSMLADMLNQYVR